MYISRYFHSNISRLISVIFIRLSIFNDVIYTLPRIRDAYARTHCFSSPIHHTYVCIICPFVVYKRHSCIGAGATRFIVATRKRRTFGTPFSRAPTSTTMTSYLTLYQGAIPISSPRLAMWSSCRSRARSIMSDLWWCMCARERCIDHRWNSLFYTYRGGKCSLPMIFLRRLRWLINLCERSDRERLIYRRATWEMAGHVGGWNHVRAIHVKKNDRIFLLFLTTRCWS